MVMFSFGLEGGLIARRERLLRRYNAEGQQGLL